MAAARASAPPDFARWYDAACQFDSLRAEALLANPLMDFDRLVLVKRADAAQRTPRPRIRGEAGTFVGNDVIGFLNGLPINFQGNGYLREIAMDNEIAILSPVRPDGQLTTLYRPDKPVFVGDLKLHFDADRLLFSSVGSHERWQIFEIGIDGSRLRQVTLGADSDIDNYDSCYLAGRPDPVRLVGLFPVGPLRAALRRSGQLLRDERRRLGRAPAVFRSGPQLLPLGDGRRPHPLYALGIHRHRTCVHRTADDDEPGRNGAASPLRERQLLAEPHFLRPPDPRLPDEIRGHRHGSSWNRAGRGARRVRRGQGATSGRREPCSGFPVGARPSKRSWWIISSTRRGRNSCTPFH